MKVFITKYALTNGIGEVSGGISDTCPTMFVSKTTNGLVSGYFHCEGREWHRTREAAIAKAESMRLVKIASLVKQIERLKKLDFSK